MLDGTSALTEMNAELKKSVLELAAADQACSKLIEGLLGAEQKKIEVARLGAKVEVVYKGNVFTVARAEYTDDKGKFYIGDGISRRMYTDKPGVTVPECLGEKVAMGRALVAMLHKVMHRPPLKQARKVTEYFKG